MKISLACYRKSDNIPFDEVYSLDSSVLRSPEQAVPALRKMLESADPDVEVLGGAEILEVENGYYF